MERVNSCKGVSKNKSPGAQHLWFDKWFTTPSQGCPDFIVLEHIQLFLEHSESSISILSPGGTTLSAFVAIK